MECIVSEMQVVTAWPACGRATKHPPSCFWCTVIPNCSDDLDAVAALREEAASATLATDARLSALRCLALRVACPQIMLTLAKVQRYHFLCVARG